VRRTSMVALIMAVALTGGACNEGNEHYVNVHSDEYPDGAAQAQLGS